MRIRKAMPEDIPAISAIYEAIHDAEEAGQVTVGWQRGVYPTADTARQALAAGTLYVLEDGGSVVAAAKIDQEQVPEYAGCPWRFPAPPEQVLVLHTLVVDPSAGRRGYGAAFVAFYEGLGRERGCPHLRLDTNCRNRAARALYGKLGYREVGAVPCVFNGIAGVELVCMEKNLEAGQ